MIYRTAGKRADPSGNRPTVVLIHGMVNSSRHWREVALALAEDHYVIAPDLIGHGDSATPRGDYSLGAHACYIRDLLTALGIDRFTLVGHSLGGGVAMQFYYQFPHRVERLILVSSGGLGGEVSPLLRSAALPGATPLLAAATRPFLLGNLWRIGQLLEEREVGVGVYLKAIARALAPLSGEGARQAFIRTLRAVIDFRGQRVSATDRLALLAGMPTLIVWGARDQTIPTAHGLRMHRLVPHSRLVLLPRSAHFPHLEEPAALAEAIGRFIAETEPGHVSDNQWSPLITGGAQPQPAALGRS